MNVASESGITDEHALELTETCHFVSRSGPARARMMRNWMQEVARLRWVAKATGEQRHKGAVNRLENGAFRPS